MAKSRAKGIGYELKIAKILSAWSGIKLRRTPLSGGWSHEHPEVMGDLVSVDPDQIFPIHCEAKNNESWNWEQIMKGKGPVVGTWWEQATSECPPHKFPVLFFSQAYKRDYVMMMVPEAWLARLSDVNYAKVGECHIIALEEFIQLFRVEDFITLKAITSDKQESSHIRQRQSDRTGDGVQH